MPLDDDSRELPARVRWNMKRTAKALTKLARDRGPRLRWVKGLDTDDV